MLKILKKHGASPEFNGLCVTIKLQNKSIQNKTQISQDLFEQLKTRSGINVRSKRRKTTKKNRKKDKTNQTANNCNNAYREARDS